MFPRSARPTPGRFTFRFSRPLLCAALAAAGMLTAPGWAAEPEPAAPAASAPGEPPPDNSGMDGNLFLQLLVGELEAQGGQQGSAYEIMLDAARRSRDEGLFQRAIELAVQSRSGDKALAAAKAWRNAMPDSSMALRMQLQLFVALDKPAELVEPIRSLIEKEAPADRGGTIASLPRFLASLADKPRALAIAEQALAPYANAAPTRTAVRTSLARLALAADQPAVALGHVRKALADDPSAPGPTLVAMELMPKDNAAEALVQAYLARSDALPPVRLAYARALDQQQRIGEAAVQLRAVLAQQPDQPAAWLTLGAYMVDLREPDEAVKALERFLSLAPTAPAAVSAAPTTPPDDGDGDGPDKADPRGMIDLSYLLLAQAQEIRGDDRAAGQWLDKIEPSRVDMSTLARRASLMARAGQVDKARALVRDAPARDQPDARTRLLAEAQVLRDQKRWAEAYELLLGGVRNDPEDTVLMYELAMVAERLNRYDDMEALLRRVITLKPDDHHAHNALGYSLADRNIRLTEALSLVQRAANLAPLDPFIADSLGWVEYRLGHNDEALKLLRRSHLARPHVEVAAHLGELLWVTGQRDEAMRVWREGSTREGDNDVMQETLTRLKVKL